MSQTTGEAYTGLKYLTRGNASPQGRPRVYFCCHPDDFAQFFGTITEELLNIQTNAAIWYYDPADGIPEQDALERDLAQMQLFVIPITGKFIYSDNTARTAEYDFAIRHHIPVLPLLQENGLEEDFNRICGNLQCLNKDTEKNDPTVLPYEEKLKSYLESVLVNDELAQKIRDAFDAYIFLSYRKKDREYAQQIMHLIHENEFCRDVAIWYDEYLTPGEDFNTAIEEAMNKSRLFAMIVTPNLLEEQNYVMTTEYPEARKAEKTILPIEVTDTDHAAIQECFQGLDGIVPIHPKELFSASLHTSLGEVALAENDSSPAHLFFIGLAYQSGIDIEVNHEKALDLITRAAEGNLPEAYEKLVSMYNNGVGVERNYLTAIEWQQKYVHMLENNPEDPYADRCLILALQTLGQLWQDLGNTSEAKSTYERLEQAAKTRDGRFHTNETKRDVALAFRLLSNIYLEEEDIQTAISYFQKNKAIIEGLSRETPSDEDALNLIYINHNIARAYIKKEQASGANFILSRCVSSLIPFVKRTNTLAARRELASVYHDYGLLVITHIDNSDQAELYFKRGFELCEGLDQEFNTPTTHRWLAEAYNDLGKLHEYIKERDAVSTDYQNALEIYEQLAQETHTLQDRRGLALSCMNLANAIKSQGDFQKAQSYYEKGLAISLKLVEESCTIQARQNLVDYYNNCGQFFLEIGAVKEAKTLLQNGLELNQELMVESNTIQDQQRQAVIYHNIGKICSAEGNLIEAALWHNKALAIRKKLAEESWIFQNRHNLADSYRLLMLTATENGDYDQAIEYWNQEHGIYEELVHETKNNPARLLECNSYYDLGELYYQKGDTKEAFAAFEKWASSWDYLDRKLEYRALSGKYHQLEYVARCQSIANRYDEAESNTGANEYLNRIYDAMTRKTFNQKLSWGEHTLDETQYLAKISKRLLGWSISRFYDRHSISEQKELDYYFKANQRLAKDIGTKESYRDLAIAAEWRGNIRIKELERRSRSAGTYYQIAINSLEKLVQDYHEEIDCHNLAIMYEKMGIYCQHKCDLEEALSYYQKRQDICLALKTDLNLHEHRSSIAKMYRTATDAYLPVSDYEQYVPYYITAIHIAEDLAEENASDAYGLLDSIQSDFSIFKHENGIYGSRYIQNRYQKEAQIYTRLIQETNHPRIRLKLAKCYHILGENYRQDGNLSEAESLLLSGLTIAQQLTDESYSDQNQRILADINYTLGFVYELANDCEKAQKHYETALQINLNLLQISQLLHDQRNVTKCYHVLGILTNKEGNSTDAKNYYWKAYSIRRAIADKSGLAEDHRVCATTCNNLGRIYHREGNLKQAGELYHLDITYLNQTFKRDCPNGLRQKLVNKYLRLAEVYEKEFSLLKNYKEKEEKMTQAITAYSNAFHALPYSSSIKDQAECQRKIANLYYQQGHLADARKYYQQVCYKYLKNPAFAESEDPVYLAQIYINLGDCWCKEWERDNRQNHDKATLKENAISNYQKAQDIYLNLDAQHSTPQTRGPIGMTYYRIGMLGSKEDLQKAYDTFQELAQSDPDGKIVYDLYQEDILKVLEQL